MSRSAVMNLVDHIRRLAGGAPVADDHLLADFLARRDEATFAALVGRHGPMVWNLCRRILRDAHAAEDAFQATFLVLAERASSIRRRASLASWLHGVAYRLAVRAKRSRDARLGRDEVAAVVSDPVEQLAWQEMLSILDEELLRLPERHRAPLVLCYLDGLTQDEAAQVLGWSVGTLRRRLGQGRERLQARLRVRGVSLPAALSGLLAAGTTVAVSGPLQAATVAAALLALKQGGGIMHSAWVKTLLALTVSVGVALGVGFWVYTTHPPRRMPARAPSAEAVDDALAQAARAIDEGKVVNWAILKELAVLEARRGNPAAARQRFAQAADRVATTSGYSRAAFLVMMAYGIASAGDPATAQALVEEARRLARTLADRNEQHEILRFAAVCCGEKISHGLAMTWAKEIPDEGFRLNAIRDIAVAQADAGDVAAALRTVELIHAPLEHARLRAWQAIAAAQLKARDQSGAAETLGKALALIARDREGTRDAALGTEVEFLLHYAVTQAESGDQAAARQTLQRVEKLLEPGARAESFSLLASLARAQAQAGERRQAARTVARCLRIKEQYGYDGVPLPLIIAQIRLGDFDGAVKFARDLTQPQGCFDVFQVFGEVGPHEAALAAAGAYHSPEARAWALLGVASGMVNRLPRDGRLRYPAGTFALVIPNKPGQPAAEKEDPASAARAELQGAIDEWERAWAEFNARLDKAKSPEERQKMLEQDRPSGDRCARRLLALAAKHRGQPIAFEALAWIVERSSLTPAGPEALSLLVRDHLTAREIGTICSFAAMMWSRDPNTEKLLRATLQSGPHRAARAEACLALADWLKGQAAQARAVQRRPMATDDPADWKRLRSLDPAQLEAEAEKLYERILAEFADIFPSRYTRPLGQAARAALDEIRLLAVGKTAPDIEGKDLDGKPLRLSDHRGKVVVLVFWAKWCGPCRQMIPHERALVKRLAGKPFVLLGINSDGDQAGLRRWLEKNPLPWRSWWDGGNGDGAGRIAQAWNVSSWPTVYVLDGRGVIRYKDVHDKELDDAVDSLLR